MVTRSEFAFAICLRVEAQDILGQLGEADAADAAFGAGESLAQGPRPMASNVARGERRRDPIFDMILSNRHRRP